MISQEQKRKMEEAKREAHEKTDNVCADGQKHAAGEYDVASNQINNE